MFDYIYLEEIKVVLLLWISLMLLMPLIKKKHRFTYPTIIVFIVLIIINIYKSYVFEENIELFNQNKKLECSAYRNNYSIIKSNGWVVDKQYFSKGDLLVQVVDCEEF